MIWHNDTDAIQFLRERGYRLRPNFTWAAPPGCVVPTSEESSALEYLWDEWDFGGLERELA